MNPLNPYFNEIFQINSNPDFNIRDLSVFLGIDSKKVHLTSGFSPNLLVPFAFCFFRDFMSSVIQGRFVAYILKIIC